MTDKFAVLLKDHILANMVANSTSMKNPFTSDVTCSRSQALMLICCKESSIKVCPQAV